MFIKRQLRSLSLSAFFFLILLPDFERGSVEFTLRLPVTGLGHHSVRSSTVWLVI